MRHTPGAKTTALGQKHSHIQAVQACAVMFKGFKGRLVTGTCSQPFFGILDAAMQGRRTWEGPLNKFTIGFSLNWFACMHWSLVIDQNPWAPLDSCGNVSTAKATSWCDQIIIKHYYMILYVFPAWHQVLLSNSGLLSWYLLPFKLAAAALWCCLPVIR